MATVRAVEGRIEKVEGFSVRILHVTGTDMRSDRSGVPQYPYERALRNSASVRDWRQGRFLQTYPGFDVEVLDARGRKVHGGTLLSTVRDTYLD